LSVARSENLTTHVIRDVAASDLATKKIIGECSPEVRLEVVWYRLPPSGRVRYYAGFA
jgi:hypothetical protein